MWAKSTSQLRAYSSKLLLPTRLHLLLGAGRAWSAAAAVESGPSSQAHGGLVVSPLRRLLRNPVPQWLVDGYFNIKGIPNNFFPNPNTVSCCAHR